MVTESEERLANSIAGWMPKNARRSVSDGHVHTSKGVVGLDARFLTVGLNAGLANELSVSDTDESTLDPVDIKFRWNSDDFVSEHGVIITDDQASSGLPAFIQPDTLRLPNDPTGLVEAKAGKIVVYAYGDQLWAVLSQGGQKFGPFVLGTSEGYVAGRHHLGSLVATPSLAFYSTDGLLDGVQLTPATTSVSLGANGLMAVHTTGAVIGDDAGVAQINFAINREFDCLSLTKFRLPDTTSVRMFIGWSNQNLATMVGADTPAGQYFGLQKRAGDANWFWVGRGTGALTRTSTAIAVSTEVKFIRFSHGPSTNIVCQLFSAGFGFQNVAALSGAAMPASTTTLRFIAGVETQAAASRALHHGYTYLIGVT